MLCYMTLYVYVVSKISENLLLWLKLAEYASKHAPFMEKDFSNVTKSAQKEVYL